MAKQLNVNLGFTADTSQAAAQIQNLQNQLTGLLNSTNGSMNFGSKVVGDVNKASKAIAELKLHLKNATNVNTGTLDFTKLNESIGKSGMTLQQYGDKLRSLGPAGQQAFNALANSVAQSEIPIRRSNAALTEMWTTLKNTARWQISSSILHGFMGSISAAVGYAKDLNKSLNDIRIVTGASVDEMARFAEQANRSAKALSASTTEYTKASLIYYQQGLDDQAVKERTDVTIKMANVSGQTAEMVSDQMTAVWNNFAKGGEDLERFADVMVRLGAETASSSDEIAQGLEKFAAIGDTVGLSFDNAAAALATVTATTRQSADIVGTAFKTIFARIQGLKLGETLEDGTDLNKYSEALATVGISIKEQNGELKDMDNILAEMGIKWQTLSKDQQVALAQTVAGVRQYNQLIALMDNFDFYEQNLQSAKNAEGSLQEQADIYAESWQAASDRVKAATQGIYEDLLNDEAFIDVLNTIEKILTYVDNLIDGLGGLGGVLTTVGALLTRAFSAQIAQGITSMTNGIKMMTAAGREQAQQQKAQFMKDSADAMRNMSDGSNEGNMRATMMEDQLRLQTSMIENSERMSAEEQQINQMLLDRQRILSDNAIVAAKELDAATEAKSDATMEARTDIASARINRDDSVTTVNQAKSIKQLNAEFTALQTKIKSTIKIRADFKELSKIPEEGRKASDILNTIKEKAKELNNVRLNGVVNALKEADLEGENFEVTMAKLDATMERVNAPNILNMSDMGIRPETIEQLVGSMEREVAANEKVEQATNEANAARDRTQASINGATGAQKTWADQMVAGANVVMSVMSALQAFNGIIDVATNPDMSGWEKFLSIGSSLAMMFVMLAPLLQGTNLQFLTMAATSIAGALGVKTFSAAEMEAAISGNMAAAGTATFATALWTLLWPIGLVMAAIAALVLVVGGLNKLFKSFDEGEKLKRLEEETQNASEAFDRTKEKINETKTALDSLESGYETIEKLKEGTLEWYEAIGNVNAEVMKLVETYPELAQFVQSENGVLNITEQGQSWLQTEMAKQYAASQNVLLGAQTREKEQKIEIGKNTYQNPSALFGQFFSETTEIMQAMYNEPRIGEQLFTQAGAQLLSTIANQEAIQDIVQDSVEYDFDNYSIQLLDEFADSLGGIDWNNTDAIKEAAKNMFSTKQYENIDFDELSQNLKLQKDSMYNLIISNEEHIKQQKMYQDSVSQLEKLQLENITKSIGSNRQFNEVVELLGDKSYQEIKADKKAEVTKVVNKGGLVGWRDHVNYNGNEEWIQTFMKQVGASDYVAQRNGEMVLKIEGNEQSFSRDEVINSLTDYYATGEAQTQIITTLSESVSEAYKIGVDNLLPEDIVNLDNLALGIKKGISRGFQGSEEELNQKVNGMTQGIGKAYGSDIEALTADTSHINFDDAEIQRKITGLTQRLNEGTISAEEFKIAIKEIDAVGELDSLSSVFEDAAAAMGGSKEEIAQNAAEMQNYAKHLMEVSKESDELSDELATNADSAADLAVEVTRMNNGVDKLADGIEDWSSVLKKSSATSQEYIQALSEMRGALADVLDVNADLISNDFMTDPGNLALIEEAAKGSGEAIDALRAKMDEEIILNITAGQTDEFIAKVNELDSVVQDLATNLPDIEVGAILDDTDFLAAANNLVQQSSMTADEANAYFAGIGYEPVYSTTDVENANSMQIPAGGTELSIDHISWSDVPIDLPDWFPGDHTITLPKITYSGKPVAGSPVDAEADMRLTSFSGDGKPPEIKGMRKKASGGMNNYSSGNSGGKSPGSSGGGGGGGGGSKKTPKQPRIEKPKLKTDADKKDAEDEKERYYYISNVIEDLNRELDEMNAAKDDAFGPSRIAAMDAEIKKLKEVRQATKQYAQEIADNLASDKEKARGYGAQFDSAGRITNYNELKEAWVNELNSVTVDEYNAYEQRITDLRNQSNAIDSEADEDGSQKNAIEDQIEGLENERDQKIKDAEKLFETRTKSLEQYEDTRDLLADTNAEMEEQLRQIQQLNAEKIMYKVEYKIEVNDRELKLLDKKLEAIEDTIFTNIEAFSLIGKNMNEQLKILIEPGERNPLDIYTESYKKLQEAYQLGLEGSEDGINQAQFEEKIGEIQDGLIDSYDTLVALDEKMREYYSNAIEEGLELIHNYEKGFDSFLNTLDHYSNVMTLIGREKDYEGMNMILQGRYNVLQDYIASAEETIADLQEQQRYIEAELSKSNLTAQQRKDWEERLALVKSSLIDEQSAFYNYIEQMGEAANQILKNNLDNILKELKDSMTNGMNLDHLMGNLNKVSTYQEDYLTNTNKMYETNKLLSQAQLAIDKTANAQAKQKYQEYIKYIEKLQLSEQLSKQELNMAQAKYEILEAEIALEEARNAKSEVRLTRDSEGNFGYVYTANQDDVASATQTYLDKQNALYNISLEGVQQYREKYFQNLQNMYDEIEELVYAWQVEKTISDAEFEEQSLIIQEYYYKQGISYQEQFDQAQFELAGSTYSALMRENENFNDAQLSENKDHYNVMSIADEQYVGGMYDGMTKLHRSLERDLQTFGQNSYDETASNYAELARKDQDYYTSLETQVWKTQGYIYNQMTNPGANSATSHMNRFSSNVFTAFGKCQTAATMWENMIKPLNERVGKSFSDDDNKGLQSKIDKVTDSSTTLKDKLINELHPAISTTWTKVGNVTAQWEKNRLEIDKTKESYMKLATEIQNTINKLAGFEKASAAPPPVDNSKIDPKYTTTPITKPSSSSSNSNTSTNNNSGTRAEHIAEIITKVHTGVIKQTNDGWRPSAEVAGYSQDEIAAALNAFNDSKPGGGYSYDYQKALELAKSYDTGGYTGQWGPEGRMAILHEKEIILNEQDTENFLSATMILREISQMLDNNALIASLGAINLSAATLNTEADKILQQEVTIHADFPNVSDHTEIEMAIDNLINAASQYANRK